MSLELPGHSVSHLTRTSSNLSQRVPPSAHSASITWPDNKRVHSSISSQMGPSSNPTTPRQPPPGSVPRSRSGSAARRPTDPTRLAAMAVVDYDSAKVGYKALPPPTDPKAEKVLRTRGIQNYARMHSNIERMQSEMQEFMEEQMRRAIEADPRIRLKMLKQRDSRGNPRPPTAEEEKDLDRQQELLDELISNIYGVRQSSTRFMRLFLNEEEKRHVGARTHESFGKDPGDKDRPTPRRYNPYRHHTPEESSSSRWGMGSGRHSGNTSPSGNRSPGGRHWGPDDGYLPNSTLLQFNNSGKGQALFGDDAYVSDETDEGEDTTPLQVPLKVMDPLDETRQGEGGSKKKTKHGSGSDEEGSTKKKEKKNKKDDDDSPTRKKEEHKRRKEEEKQRLRAEKEARKLERDAIRARRDEERTLKLVQREEEMESLREQALQEAARKEEEAARHKEEKARRHAEKEERRRLKEEEAARKQREEDEALMISPAEFSPSPTKSLHNSADNTDLTALNAQALLIQGLTPTEDEAPISPIVEPSTMRDPNPTPFHKTKVKNKTTYGICHRSGSTGSMMGEYEADEPFGQSGFNGDMNTDPTSVASVILRIFGDDTSNTNMNIGVSRHKYHHPRGIPSPRARSRSMATSQATTPRKMEGSIANSMPSQSVNIQSIYAVSAPTHSSNTSSLPLAPLQPVQRQEPRVHPAALNDVVTDRNQEKTRSPKSPKRNQVSKKVRSNPNSPRRQLAQHYDATPTPSGLASPQFLDMTAGRGRNNASNSFDRSRGDRDASWEGPPTVSFESANEQGSPKPKPTRLRHTSPPGGKIIKKTRAA